MASEASSSARTRGNALAGGKQWDKAAAAYTEGVVQCGADPSSSRNDGSASNKPELAVLLCNRALCEIKQHQYAEVNGLHQKTTSQHTKCFAADTTPHPHLHVHVHCAGRRQLLAGNHPGFISIQGTVQTRTGIIFHPQLLDHHPQQHRLVDACTHN